MRAKKFLVEHLNLDEIYDIGQWQLAEASRQFARESSTLYESLDSVIQVKEFLSQYKISPTVGDSYFPISVLTIPIGKIMNIARSISPGLLTEITETNLFFNFGNGPKPFPYYMESGDMLQTTILFHTLNEQEKFRSWLMLSFDRSWRISEKTI